MTCQQPDCQTIKMFGPTKARILCYVIIYNIIQANQKDEFYVYPWLRAHPLLKVACVPHLSQYQRSVCSVKRSVETFILSFGY